MEYFEKLLAVQQELKANKTQFNKFGGYAYRSCEDILEAVKPLLAKNGLVLTISDDIVSIGDRIYVRATALITDAKSGELIASTNGFAREEETKKGMDSSQVTGAASSYARKYALNGLLCIDDAKDSDATNTHGKEEPKREEPKREEKKPDGNFVPTCADCGKEISVKEHDYSVRYFKRPLCRDCQKHESSNR